MSFIEGCERQERIIREQNLEARLQSLEARVLALEEIKLSPVCHETIAEESNRVMIEQIVEYIENERQKIKDS